MDEQKRILIVDDDPDFAGAIKIILEQAKYIVESAYSPGEGYKALQTGNYDLLILDIMMGRGAEGIIFARKLRTDDRFAKLPVLMITGVRKQTGFFFPGQATHPLFLPVDELVEKPIEANVLLKKVGELLTTQVDRLKAEG